MNTYYNTYTYEMFKNLATLNLTENTEFEISDIDLQIIRAVYEDLFFKDSIHFKQFEKIVKRLSLEFLKTPVSIAMIIRDELKK